MKYSMDAMRMSDGIMTERKLVITRADQAGMDFIILDYYAVGSSGDLNRVGSMQIKLNDIPALINALQQVVS